MLAIFFHTVLTYLNFKNQKCKKITYITLAWLFVLFAFTNGGMDYPEYKWMFDNIETLNLSFGPECLFYISMYIIKMLGFNLTFYLMLISFGGLYLFYKVIIYYTENVNFVLGLFMIFPFVNFIVQKRNFLAMMIILYSTRFLFDRDNKNTLFFVIGILLATGFHSVSLFYLSLLGLERLELSKIKQYFKILVFPSFLLFIFFPQILEFLNAPEKLLIYFNFNNGMSLFSIVFLLFWQIYLVFLFYIYTKSKQSSNLRISSLGNLFEKLIFLFLLTLPLYFYSSNFIRLIRNLIPLFYIYIAGSDMNYKSKNTKKIVLLSVCFLTITILFELVSSNGFWELYMPIFQKNYLLMWFI